MTEPDSQDRFTDMAPVEDTSLDPGYGQVPTGPGRWALLADRAGVLGVLWTDDDQALGLMGLPESTAKGLLTGQNILRLAHSRDAKPTDVFDYLLDRYSAVAQAGDLTELFR